MLITTNIKLDATIDLFTKDADGWQSKYIALIKYMSKVKNEHDDLARLHENGRVNLVIIIMELDDLISMVLALHDNIVVMANKMTRVANEQDINMKECNELALDNRSLCDEIT